MNPPSQRPRWFKRRGFGLGVELGFAPVAGGVLVVEVFVLPEPVDTGASDLEFDPLVVELAGAAPPGVLLPPVPPAGAGVGVAVGSGGVVIGVGTSGSGVDNADATNVFNSDSAGSFLLRSLYTAASTPINAFLSSGLVLAAAARAKASIWRSSA